MYALGTQDLHHLKSVQSGSSSRKKRYSKNTKKITQNSSTKPSKNQKIMK